MSDVVPLNEEQQQLIVDYLEHNGWNSIKTCIHKIVKRNMTETEIDNYISVAHMALVKAAQRFSNNKNMKFSSFAIMNVQSSIKTYLTYENRKCRKGNKETRSYDEVDEDGLTLKDLLSDGKEIDINDYSKIQAYIQSLSKDAKKVLALMLQGYTSNQIKEKTGFSAKYLGQIMSQMRNEERVNLLKYENYSLKGM